MFRDRTIRNILSLVYVRLEKTQGYSLFELVIKDAKGISFVISPGGLGWRDGDL